LEWNSTFNKFVEEECGFKRATFDPCFYSSHTDDGWVCLSVSTDDCLITGTNKKLIQELRQKANARFGEGQWTPSVDSFLGINCYHNLATGTFPMDVASKITQLLDDYELQDLRGSDVPYAAELDKINPSFENYEDSKKKHISIIKANFANICGTCIYLAITCRPDIATICNQACRGMHGPSNHQILLLYYLLKYLRQTKQNKLVYRKSGSAAQNSFEVLCDKFNELGQDLKQHYIVAYGDASFADKHDERLRSTSGGTIYVFGNLVTWFSKRQSLTAKSTMAAGAQQQKLHSSSKQRMSFLFFFQRLNIESYPCLWTIVQPSLYRTIRYKRKRLDTSFYASFVFVISRRNML